MDATPIEQLGNIATMLENIGLNWLASHPDASVGEYTDAMGEKMKRHFYGTDLQKVVDAVYLETSLDVFRTFQRLKRVAERMA